MKNYLILLSLCFCISSCSFQKSISKINSFEEISYPYEVKTQLLADGKSIAFMDEGQGEPILFIHGLGSYAPAWKKNIAALSKNNRCIAIDLPGYGRSSKGNYNASMSSYAKTIIDFIDQLGLEKVSLAGHSMGGQISMMTALAFPEKVDRLILVSPAGFETFSPGEKQWFREVLTPTAVKLTPVDNIISNISSNFYQMPKDAQFMITDRIEMRNAKDFDAYCHIIPECIKGMVNEPVFEYLDRIKNRTLVIYGDSDNLIPNRFLHGGKTEDVANAGANKIPNAELHLIPKAGHFVHFEKSEQVNSIISKFLK